MAIGTILGSTVVAAGVTAAGSMASAGMGMAAQSAMNKEAMKFNREEAEKNREFQSEEAEKNREFQSEEAQKVRDYYSEAEIMKRRSEAGLNSAVAGGNTSSPAATGSPSGSAPSGSAASFGGSSLPSIPNFLGEAAVILDKLADADGKVTRNKIDKKTGLQRAISDIAKTTAETVGQTQQNEFNLQYFQKQLALADEAVTGAKLDNELKKLQKFNIDNQIQNGIEEAYFLYVENNTKLFNSLLTAENFAHQWEQDKREIQLKIEEYKASWNNMSYTHGSRKSGSISTSSQGGTSHTTTDGSNWNINGNIKVGYKSSSFPGSKGLNAEGSIAGGYGSSYTTATSGFDNMGTSVSTNEQNESFANSQLGQFAVEITALWDIANDSSKSVESRKEAVRKLSQSLSDMEAYGRFQKRIRALRGAAFVGSEALQVQ